MHTLYFPIATSTKALLRTLLALRTLLRLLVGVRFPAGSLLIGLIELFPRLLLQLVAPITS